MEKRCSVSNIYQYVTSNQEEKKSGKLKKGDLAMFILLFWTIFIFLAFSILTNLLTFMEKKKKKKGLLSNGAILDSKLVQPYISNTIY